MHTKISEEDRMILNYIISMPEEYGDKLFQNGFRKDLFWRISSIRRYSFSFYPINKDSDLLLVGDKFGTLTGVTCEKVQHVDTIVPSDNHADAIAHRYQSRENLHIIVQEYDDWNLDKQYAYALINLEETYAYDSNDSYEFDRLVKPAVKHLQEDGRLLMTARGDYLWIIQRLLYKLGFTYQQHCDPLGNGALFLEVSRTDNLSVFELQEPSPLINDRWVRENGVPFHGGEVFDQDLALIEKVKQVQIDLLRELLSVCDKYNLQMFPIYGTLLGVIRDGGMIPGDDDIDVVLMREDFDRLIELSGEFTGKYFLQTPYNDDCFYGGFIRLHNRETTAINPQNEWTDACEGISIDIFPIDSSYADIEKEESKKRRICSLQRLLYAKSYGFFRQFKDMPLLQWKAYKYIGKPFERKQIIEALYTCMRKGDEKPKKKAVYCHYGNGKLDSTRYMDANAYKDTFPLLFEGICMQVPKQWDELLKGFYGEGYKERLGFQEWKKRHAFYSVEVPYTVYKNRFGGLKNPQNIKEPVVFFGDGEIFKSCLSYYKNKVDVAHLVQLPNEKRMEKIMGIPVESWEEFHALGLEKDSYRAVICSGDARLAEKILQREGYENYYIFWYDRDWMLYANQSQVWREVYK